MSNLVIPELQPKTSINNIFCIGRNYQKHVDEMGGDTPDSPVVFCKPKSSIIFDGGLIMLPPESQEVHHEVELVVAIGKEGKRIKKEKATDYILGYGLGIDVTARDLQREAKKNGEPWTISKGFDTFAPISRFKSSDQIEDVGNLDIKLEVNGDVRQDGNTGDMIFSVDKLIAYLSTIFTLSPGDLIFTGTPEGVSKLQDGDTIRATLGDDLLDLNVSAMHEPSFS